ncbi:MAG: hypothetical protein ACI4QL_00150 [Candidatus Fimimonas sp.]
MLTKFYTQSERSFKSVAVFVLIDGILGFVVTAVLSKLNISLHEVIFGIIIGALSCFNFVAQLKAYQSGDLSVYSLFLMLGGMILPVFYGAIFLVEEFSAIYYVTVPLIVVCMFLSISPQKFKHGKRYYLLCLAAFVSNGVISVMSKTYSVSYNNDCAMLCVKYAVEVVFAVTSLIIAKKAVVLQNNAPKLSDCASDENCDSAVAEKKAAQAAKERSIFSKKTSLIYAVGAFVFSGLAYLIQLSILKNSDAVFFFPLQTSGTILLTFIVGKVILKEGKNTRELIFTAGILLSFILTILYI